MTQMAVTTEDQVGSPVWWIRRLHTRIQARRDDLDRLQQYYDGDFPWKYADAKLKQTFGTQFYASRLGVNWMRLIVSAVEERLRIDGIRVGPSEDNDETAWDIWQANDLDELSSSAHLEALINGIAYVTVWPGEDDRYPDITVEHPIAADVELDPQRPRRRLAGLRLYTDIAGYLRAQLFLPDAVHMFRSTTAEPSLGTWDAGRMEWILDADLDETGVMQNPWGVVPMVPLANVPQLTRWVDDASACMYRSELWPVMPTQDAINSVLFNTLLAANAQGFRQRWATGLTIDHDEDGKPIEPFKAGIDRLFLAESPDTKFGEFNATDITPLIRFIDQLVGSIASQSSTPSHYMNASADRLSGESIKASEAGLIAKVRRKQIAFGGTWEEVMRIAGMMTDNPSLSEARAAEIVWGNPETRGEAQTADSAVKLKDAGVPWTARMEHLGYSPQRIKSMRAERDRENANTQGASDQPPATSPPTMPPNNGAPVAFPRMPMTTTTSTP